MKVLRSNKFLTALVALALIFCAGAFGLSLYEKNAFGFSGGTGTYDNPYLITDKIELRQISEYDADGVYFKLMNHIGLDMYEDWIPLFGITDMNDPADAFKGNFDGNGYEIRHLYQVDNTGYGIWGLFGIIGESGSVKNLRIYSGGGIGGSNSANGMIGGFASINRGRIDNCSICGGINRTYDDVGGLVGLNIGVINNCYNESEIQGCSNVGGIAAFNGGYYINQMYAGTIINSYNTGRIGNSHGDSVNVGGIAGSNSLGSIVSGCYNIANLGNSQARSFGGIIGSNSGSIKASYNMGDLSGYSNIGGISGDNLGSIGSCFNAGNINGQTSVGGIVGGYCAVVLNCYNTGNIEGYNFVGGIIGGVETYDVSILHVNYIYNGGIVKQGEGSGDALAPFDFTNGHLAESYWYYNIDYSISCHTVPSGNRYFSTEEMTLDSALSNIGLMAGLQNANSQNDNIWIKRANAAGFYYYPELAVFYNSYNGAIQEASKESVKMSSIKGPKETLDIDIENWIYGEMQNEPLISEAGSYGYNGPQTIYYKASGAIDSTYTTEVPVNAGRYVMRVERYSKVVLSAYGKTEFEILKATPIITTNPTAAGITYGAALSASLLSGGEANIAGAFIWVNDAVKPTVVNNGFAVVFMPDDADNYNTVTVNLAITVAKAIPVYTVPTNLEAKVGQKLSEISLPEGFSWVDGTLDVGAAGENRFLIKYTPSDTANYEAVSNIEVSVKVKAETTSKNTGLSQGATIGIITGCIALAALGAVVMSVFIVKRRKQKGI